MVAGWNFYYDNNEQHGDVNGHGTAVAAPRRPPPTGSASPRCGGARIMPLRISIRTRYATVDTGPRRQSTTPADHARRVVT